MIEYPAELAYPDLSGYSLEHAPNLSRTTMVSGRARQRRKYTSVPSFVTLSWGMPQKEFELFEAWFRWELKEGQEWFTGWAQTGGITTQTVMRFVGSDSGPAYTARMNGPDYWSISCRLEIREKQTFADGWQHLPQYILFPSILDMAINREWPESKYQTFMGAFDEGINEEWPE